MFSYRKKVISVILTFTLIMAMLPVQIFARSSNFITQVNNVTTQITSSSGIAANPYKGEDFEAEFKVLNQWEGNFTGEIKITNTGRESIENWILTFNFGQAITSIWNAAITSYENDKYIIKNLGWNQDIAVGESITIGFNGTWDEQISVPTNYKMLGVKERVEASNYSVGLDVISNWEEAFTGELRITNKGNEPIEDWMLEFDFDRNIQQFWAADIVEHEGIHYVIKNKGYNANIGPGDTLTLGFMADPGNGDIEASNYVLTQVLAGIENEEIDYEQDSDNDDLPDYIEEILGTDINNEDTDGDGLQDGYEYWELLTNPLLGDSDNNGILDGEEDFDEDGLNNLEEYRLGTDPYNSDTDQDGLGDGDEVHKYGTDPLTYNEINYDLDSDGDGLADDIEIRLGTNPTKADTDDDSLSDGYEIGTTRTNPLMADSDNNRILDGDEDFDQDGLSNLAECKHGTNPWQADTDQDGVLDGEEILNYKTDPLKYDTDGDSIGDGDEVKLGFNPLSPSTNGILDSQHVISQSVSEEALAYVNTSDNAYELQIDLKATGNAADKVIVANSQYANALSDNQSVIGKTISIDYFEGEIKEGKLHFKLNEDLFEQNEFSRDAGLQGLKQYYVFNYNEEIGLLVPTLTTYDLENNILEADMVGTGTYCVMNLVEWLTEVGALNDSIGEASDMIYAAMSLNREAVPVSEKVSDEVTRTQKKKQVDLVFVVDTGYSMESTIQSVKDSIQEIFRVLKENSGLDVEVSIIDYKDIREIERTQAVHINGTIAYEAEGNRALSFSGNNEKIDAILDSLTLEGGNDRSGTSTPLAGLAYVSTLPFRANASKFVLLVTDKSYAIDNYHGYTSNFSFIDELKEKGISLSVSYIGGTTVSSNYRRWVTRIERGVFVLIRNLEPTKTDFTNFVVTNLIEQKEFTVLKSTSLGKIELEAPLVKGGSTDTDKDGLTDSQEVKWGDEEFVDDAVSIKCTAEGYELPCLRDLWGDIWNRYGYSSEEFIFSEAIGDLRILPLLSDPTLKDSDDDGLMDTDDTMPFINDYKVAWSKITYEDDIYYYGQLNYDQSSLRCIKYNIVSGQTTVKAYNYEQDVYEEVNEKIDVEKLRVSQEIEDAIVSEEGIVTFNVPYNPDQPLVIDLDPLKDFSLQIIEQIEGQEEEDELYRGEGVLLGVIDSCFISGNIGATIPCDLSGRKTIKQIIIPSSEKVKKNILAYQGISESDLDTNAVYLKAKITTEDMVRLLATVSTAAGIISGASKLVEGGFKIIGGGIALPETGGASGAVIGYGILDTAAGCAILRISNVCYSIADNASGKAAEDREKLEGASNSGYYFKGKKEIPKGSTRIRKDTANVKSEEFKEFIRSQGKSFKSNEWKKVMETWRTPDGEFIEVHYWRNSKTGEIWSHK